MTQITFHVITLFPEYFASPLQESILKRAIASEKLSVVLHQLRDFTTDKHRTVDDLPFGGGPGMVLKPEPLAAAIDHARSLAPAASRILLTPQGETFQQSIAEELSLSDDLILICGHYEGVDERIRLAYVDREISIGDYVLTGGEPAALVLIDAIARLRPDVLGNMESIADESFQGCGLEYPHYTRPRSFNGMEVPEVLLSGHHAKIQAWRSAQSQKRTRDRRPDLLGQDKDVNQGNG